MCVSGGDLGLGWLPGGSHPLCPHPTPEDLKVRGGRKLSFRIPTAARLSLCKPGAAEWQEEEVRLGPGVSHWTRKAALSRALRRGGGRERRAGAEGAQSRTA